MDLFKALPPSAAVQARGDVARDFKSWHVALKAFARDPSKFEGRPRMPGFAGAHDRKPIRLQASAMPRAGKLDGKLRLPPLAGASLFLDLGKDAPLSAGAQAAWAASDPIATIGQHAPAKGKAQSQP